jgi:hypothetical protein
MAFCFQDTNLFQLNILQLWPTCKNVTENISLGFPKRVTNLLVCCVALYRGFLTDICKEIKNMDPMKIFMTCEATKLSQLWIV